MKFLEATKSIKGIKVETREQEGGPLQLVNLVNIKLNKQ